MIVQFPASKSRLVLRREMARRPRRSKNGTPEERAAKKAAQSAPVVPLPGHVGGAAPQLPQRSIADDRAAIVARAEQIVELLRSRLPTAPRFDERRAALFLENIRTFDEHNGDDPRFTAVLEWVGDHNQSLDWIFAGDPSGMICRLAAQVAS